MAEVIPSVAQKEDALLVVLARELAMNLRPLDEILSAFHLTAEKFDRISETPRFTQLLQQHTLEWEAAANTHERTKLKASTMIEDWLPEAHRRLHDNAETLNSKTELAKLVTKLAGMGLDRADVANTGEKVSITINLGGDTKLKFEHNVTPKVIDADAID